MVVVVVVAAAAVAQVVVVVATTKHFDYVGFVVTTSIYYLRMNLWMLDCVMMAIYLIKFHVAFNLDIYQWTKSPRDTTFAIDISPSFGFWTKETYHIGC